MIIATSICCLRLLIVIVLAPVLAMPRGRLSLTRLVIILPLILVLLVLSSPSHDPLCGDATLSKCLGMASLLAVAPPGPLLPALPTGGVPRDAVPVKVARVIETAARDNPGQPPGGRGRVRERRERSPEVALERSLSQEIILWQLSLALAF